ncbi:hypothetical protein NMG60_11008085 [Bertholletia excelsa]
MHPRPEHSRLCRLIDDKEREKELLIVLSQVFRQINRWINEDDIDSDNGMLAEVPASTSKCSGGSQSDSEDHDCLAKIIADLILMISFESQYVQHLAGNILVAISGYLVAYVCGNLQSQRFNKLFLKFFNGNLFFFFSLTVCFIGNSWDDYMQSLCICLKLAISNALLHSLEHPAFKKLLSSDDPSIVIITLERKLKNANWALVACVIQVFRNILKHLKQGVDDHLLHIYLVSTSSCLASIPWDLIDELHVDPDGKTLRMSSGDASLAEARQLESRTFFLGALVQFVCSLVDQNGWREVADGSSDMNPLICKICSLIPRILAWCFGDGDLNTCLSECPLQMLMIRLSFQTCLEYSLLVSWLQLIHVYFEDLLLLPMMDLEPEQHSLEGSPFLASVSDARFQHMTSIHLQRLVVFLFLRCCFSLFGLKDGMAEHCGCANPGTCMKSDTNCDFVCCLRKKGLSELYSWTEKHHPGEMSVGCEFYLQRCTRFSVAFFKLFVYEDDILFKVLLQLFSVSCFKRDAKSQVFLCSLYLSLLKLLSEINGYPVCLVQLHYDHQVLLDYLISKDTGASSAEYLLRSLRVVCDSWDVFMEFTLEGGVTNMKDVNKSSEKKRKVPADGSDFQGHLTSSPVKRNGMHKSLGNQFQGDLTHGGKHYCRLSFEDAKNCLLSLKRSMVNLHHKNLFPYNPDVFLRRYISLHIINIFKL